MAHVAERAAPVQMSPMIMKVAGAFAEAFTDVRAARLLAHRMQFVFAQIFFDLAEARRARPSAPDANPPACAASVR